MSNCIFLKIRSKDYIKYLYCTKKRHEIQLNNCKQCININYKQSSLKGIKTSIKKRTSKLRKLEKNRFSVFTDNLDVCIECFKRKDHLHEIYYGRNRQKSMLYGFVIPLCEECHRKIHKSPKTALKWKIEGQLKFELSSSRDEFISIFGKSYLLK